MNASKNLKENRQQVLKRFKDNDLVIIGTDNTIKYATVNGDKFGLEEVQVLVGGLIDMVPSKFLKNHYVICNDEGHLLNLPYNAIATTLFGYYLVGNIVIIRRKLFE